MKKLSKILLIGLVILIVGGVIKPYLKTGFPYTHDGENHLARFANYKVALKEGQYPPRFAPNLMNHYGYPAFNYNYPLANILSLPFSILRIPYQLTFKILATLSIISALGGSYLWLKSLNFKKSNQANLILAVSTVLLAPVVINLTHYRGNIGELMVLAVFPWLLWEIKLLATNTKSQQKKTWWLPIFFIFDLTVLLLAHNVSALFGGVILGLYGLYLTGLKPKKWLKFLGLGLVSILLSLWFWIPAMAEKSLIILDKANLSSQFVDHFVSLSQLLLAPFSFGYSYITKIDTLNFSLGLVVVVSMILASLFFIKNKAFRKRNWFYVLISLFLIFLQTPQSYFLWKNIPLVGFIQFPWRLQIFGIFFTLPLILNFLENKFLKKLIIVLMLFQVFNIYQAKPVDYFNKTNLDYDLFVGSTSTIYENLPLDFTYIYVSDWQPKPTVFAGDASFEVQHWDGSSRNYKVVVNEKAIIIEPTMNFAGWETKNGDEQLTYLNTREIEGRLAYELEPGEYQIETKFTQNTLPRKIGNWISGLTFLGFASWSVGSALKHAKKTFS